MSHETDLNIYEVRGQGAILGRHIVARDAKEAISIFEDEFPGEKAERVLTHSTSILMIKNSNA